jgi:hypothetical protein
MSKPAGEATHSMANGEGSNPTLNAFVLFLTIVVSTRVPRSSVGSQNKSRSHLVVLHTRKMGVSALHSPLKYITFKESQPNISLYLDFDEKSHRGSDAKRVRTVDNVHLSPVLL